MKASGPSNKQKCVTTYSRQDFIPSETQATDNESRRGSLLQIIGDIVIERDNNPMKVDEHPTIDYVQKPRPIIGVRLNKAPKTSAERGREFRARKALLKQQSKQQQESDAIVEIATEDNQNAGPSNKDNRKKSDEEGEKKGVSELSKKNR